jgi:hypothetical protein
LATITGLNALSRVENVYLKKIIEDLKIALDNNKFIAAILMALKSL